MGEPNRIILNWLLQLVDHLWLPTRMANHHECTPVKWTGPYWSQAILPKESKLKQSELNCAELKQIGTKVKMLWVRTDGRGIQGRAYEGKERDGIQNGKRVEYGEK